MPDLYPASLNGFPLDIETITDDFAKAIARYEFPYKDGALLDDMGQKARTCKFKCYFWDSADQQTYDVHVAFINSLSQETLFTFVHPTYGPIQGCVESVSVMQDDRERMAEVEITFVENLRGTTSTIQVTPAQDVVGECQDAFSTSILQAIAAFGAEAQSFLGSAASAIVNQVLNPAIAILGQFNRLAMTPYFFVEAVANGITALNATLPGVANSTTSLLAATTFAPNLPGMAVQAVAKAIERIILNRQSLEANPTNWSATIINDFAALPAAILQAGVLAGGPTAPAAGPTGRVNTVTLPKLIWMQAASAAALELASIYTRDQQNWTTAQQTQLENAFDMLGNYVYPDVPGAPLMTQTALQQTLSDVRSIIQNAIDFYRYNEIAPSTVASTIKGAGSSVDGLKQSALALQNQVNNELLERGNLVQVVINNPTPLHLICMMNKVPYNTAELLWAVNRQNGLTNPNAVSGKVWVYQA